MFTILDYINIAKTQLQIDDIKERLYCLSIERELILMDYYEGDSN